MEKEFLSLQSISMPYFDFIPNEIVEGIFYFINFGKSNWFSVKLTCKRFLVIGEKLFDPSIHYQLAIRWACMSGSIICLNKLLQDPRVVLSNRCLKIAAERGHVEIVSALLSNPKVDPSAEGNISLRNACMQGHASVVEVLLQNSRVYCSPTFERDQANALREAYERGQAKCIEIFLVYTPFQSEDMKPYLRGACRSGYLDVVQVTMAHVVFPTTVLGDMFIDACNAGEYPVAKFLSPYATIRAGSTIHSALLSVIRKKHIGILELILNHPDSTTPHSEALSVAISVGFEEAITTLLRFPDIARKTKLFNLKRVNKIEDDTILSLEEELVK